MKRSTLLLCLLVWSVSLLTAYYIGSQKKEAAPPAAAMQTAVANSDPEDRDVPSEDSLVRNSTSALEAFLDDEGVALEEALRIIPDLSGSVTRELLNEALALPKSNPKRTRLINELLSQLAETEPLAALELASQIESLRDSERARISVLEVWATNDPASALAWANQALTNEPARSRSSQLSAIYRGYAANNPDAAFQQALTLDDERLRNRLLGDVIETQIESGGLQAAQVAVDLIKDPELQNNLRRDLIDEWAQFDPEAAANYVRSLGDDTPTSFKTTLISEWAESDPVAAAAWLVSLPRDDPAIARASASIIQEWTRYDLAASAEWLNSLPPSPELDRAVISYTFRAAEEDPAAAMTWAESIENDRRRTWMMERVAATWKEQDAGTFQSYLNASELTNEQREKLKNADNSGGGWSGRWRD